MKNIPLPLLPLLVLPLTAAAQEPKDMPTKAAPVELQSLQTIVVEAVHRRQPTATADGSSHDTAFARIRDAEFSDDGRLAAFVVEAPPDAKVPAGPQRRLPASAVRWDPSTRRWLLVTATQQLEELEEVPPTPAEADGKRPATKMAHTTRRASELLRSEPSDASESRPAKVMATKDATAAARIVWWFAPTAQQLAVAVVPSGDKHVVVPWSALRFDGSPTTPKVRVEPPTNLPTAPRCEHGDAMPDGALRRRSYEHFGVTPPSWDRPPAEGTQTPKDSGKGKESDQG